MPRLRVAGADLERVSFYRVETGEGIEIPFSTDDLADFLRLARSLLTRSRKGHGPRGRRLPARHGPLEVQR